MTRYIVSLTASFCSRLTCFLGAIETKSKSLLSHIGSKRLLQEVVRVSLSWFPSSTIPIRGFRWTMQHGAMSTVRGERLDEQKWMNKRSTPINKSTSAEHMQATAMGRTALGLAARKGNGE